MLIEGINTTEGTGGAGFYFDYASLEEVFLGTIGQGAEMPNPGVQSQFLGKSGGNKFQGEFYHDLDNNGCSARTSPRTCRRSSLYDPAPTPAAIRVHSNEIAKYHDYEHQRRRPDQEGQGLVVLLRTATRRTRSASRTSSFDRQHAFDTKLWNPSARAPIS